jgi:hypothetical protein
MLRASAGRNPAGAVRVYELTAPRSRAGLKLASILSLIGIGVKLLA